MKKMNQFVSATGVLVLSDAKKEGFSRESFYYFVKKNHFERIGNGIYLSPDAWKDELFVLHKRCPQAVFSHEEALYHYGLTDREPVRHVMTIYTGYNTKRLVDSGCKVYTIKKELLELGKISVLDQFGNEIPMYDLERTICDIVRSRSHIEIQDFNSALKGYVRRSDKNLNRLMEYAKQFHLEEIIRSYMEVLL